MHRWPVKLHCNWMFTSLLWSAEWIFSSRSSKKGERTPKWSLYVSFQSIFLLISFHLKLIPPKISLPAPWPRLLCLGSSAAGGAALPVVFQKTTMTLSAPTQQQMYGPRRARRCHCPNSCATRGGKSPWQWWMSRTSFSAAQLVDPGVSQQLTEQQHRLFGTGTYSRCFNK